MIETFKAISDEDILKATQQINKLYFSNLRFKLKNDCVCRLLAELFEDVSFASILLYDSEVDKLVNYGHFMSPSQYSLSEIKDEKVKFTLRNISIYEYFSYKFKTNSLQTCSYSDFEDMSFFRSESIFLKNGNRVEMNNERFNEIKNDFFTYSNKDTEPNGYKLYKDCKLAIVTKDRYDLESPKELSDTYFIELIDGTANEQDKKFKLIDSHLVDENKKSLPRLYKEKLGISIKGNSIYVAFPLNVNGRTIGLLRFLWYSSSLEQKKDQRKERGELESWLTEHHYNHLEPLSDIIACHIGNSYPKHEFKKIEWKNLNDSKSESGNSLLQKFCESLRSTINSRVCIIRTSDDESTFPDVKGWTKILDEYVRNLSGDDHLLKNFELLNSIFDKATNKKTNEKLTLIGIQFSIGLMKVSNVKLLYFSESEVLYSTLNFEEIHEKAEKDLFYIFDTSVFKKLNALKIHTVVLIRIPHIKNGYVTLGNTRFRPLIDTDIDVIYPQINRLGSELLIIKGYEKDKKIQDFKTKADLLERINHEIENPIKGVKKLLNSINSDEAKIQQHNFLYADQALKIISFIEEVFNIESISNTISQSQNASPTSLGYSLDEFLSNNADIFSGWAYYDKNLKIIKRLNAGPIYIRHNRFRLKNIFFNLMENAIKHSLRGDVIREKYDDEAEIVINSFSDKQVYGFSIMNRCNIIQGQGDLFKFGYKQSRNSEGHGRGLSYAKQYANEVSAELNYDFNPYKNSITFIIKWQNHIK